MSRRYSLAGTDFSAAPETLRYLLLLALEPTTDKATLVAAVELDPVILLALLGSSGARQSHSVLSLDHWHEPLDRQALLAVVIALANAVALQGPASAVPPPQDWRQRSQASQLAAALAARMPGVSATSARLAVLLLGLVNEDPAPATSIAANPIIKRLRDIGCPATVVDALRFAHLPVEALTDAPELIRVVALTEQLLAPLLTAGVMLDTSQARAVELLLGISTTELSALYLQAHEQHAQLESQLTGALSPFSEDSTALACLLADAGVIHAFHKSLVGPTAIADPSRKLLAAGQFLFGFSGILHFFPQDDCLLARVAEDESLRVGMQHPDSLVARCYQQTPQQFAQDSAQQRATLQLTADTATALVDVQLLDRLSAQAVLLLPLGSEAGVLVCALDMGVTDRPLPARRLLAGFAAAARQAYVDSQSSDAASAMLPVAYVRQRVSEVTHEVNNPLAIVQNYLHTLSMKLDEDAPVQVDIATIGSELMRVSSIVEKYAQIGTTADLLVAVTDINQVLKQLLGVFRGGSTDIDFVLELDPAMPQVTLAADSLKQVIVNLVKNAVEALQDTAVNAQNDKRLLIQTSSAVNVGGTQYVEIAITDNGPGISPLVRQRLFQPDNSTKGGRHGGVGLSIVKQLVDDMQGMISCRSPLSGQIGTGTCFQILIPLTSPRSAHQK